MRRSRRSTFTLIELLVTNNDDQQWTIWPAHYQSVDQYRKALRDPKIAAVVE